MLLYLCGLASVGCAALGGMRRALVGGMTDERRREQLKQVRLAVEALSEWPMGWHNPKAFGGSHFQVDYTVAKARRMEGIYLAACEALVELEKES